MQPTVKFDRTLVTVLVDEVVHVLLELAAPPAAPVERAPLDVVMVLDRSGSMSGAPLASVTAATAQLLRLAGSDDRIGVVAFDDDVQLALPLATHDADTWFYPGHGGDSTLGVERPHLTEWKERGW